ncbi:hypothetical protein LBX01_08450 [Altererythrobacter sp. N1]|nr:hypothetical protein LBX01_08450 [Altererythrobacter sp. N1]
MKRVSFPICCMILLAGCGSQSASHADDAEGQQSETSTAETTASTGQSEANEDGIRKGRFRTLKPLQYVYLASDGLHQHADAFTPEKGYPNQNVHQDIATFLTHWTRNGTVEQGASAIFGAERQDALSLECSVNPGEATLTLGDSSAYYNGPVPIERGSWRQRGNTYTRFMDIDFKNGRYVLKNDRGEPISDGDGEISRNIEAGSDGYVCFDKILSPVSNPAFLTEDKIPVPTTYTYCASGLNPKTMEWVQITSDVPTVRLNGDGITAKREFVTSMPPVKIGLSSGICRPIRSAS